MRITILFGLSWALLAGAAPPTQDAPAEPPLWPVGFKLPADLMAGWKRAEQMRESPQADVLVWTPPNAARIRAVMLIPQNTDSKHVGEHAAVRAVAAKQEIGIVYLRHFGGEVIERSDPPEHAEATFAALLDLIAAKTGVGEYRHAPWITFGKSSRGRFPFRATWWFPDRVIASISYHGETPTWPMADWSRVGDESVLHLAINGQEEWDGTWYRHVRPCLLNYHAHTEWLAHQVVLPNLGHGNYADVHGSPGWGRPVPEGQVSCLQVWDYIALYIDKAMERRVPRGVYPTDGPTKLKPVDRDSGWLIHPRAPEALLDSPWMAFRRQAGDYAVIPWPEEKHPVLDAEQGHVARELLLRRAKDVPADERRACFWVADLEQARAWLALHDPRGRWSGLLDDR